MIFIFGPLLCLVCVGNMTRAAYCDLFLYANNSYLVYQQKGVRKIEQNLSKKFYYICDWFLDNELGIHIGDNKTKRILNGNKYVVLILDMTQYTSSNVRQWHISVAHRLNISPENQWPWKLLIKLNFQSSPGQS